MFSHVFPCFHDLQTSLSRLLEAQASSGRSSSTVWMRSSPLAPRVMTGDVGKTMPPIKKPLSIVLSCMIYGICIYYLGYYLWLNSVIYIYVCVYICIWYMIYIYIYIYIWCYSISILPWLMWVKHCHKPPMTGNGKHTTYKNDDDWGVVYSTLHIHMGTWMFRNIRLRCWYR